MRKRLSAHIAKNDKTKMIRETTEKDYHVASFHGESYKRCHLCGKVYDTSCGWAGIKIEYCPFCKGYKKVPI